MTDTPHILIITGSPRVAGNTMHLAKLAVDEMTSRGVRVSLAHCVQTNIKGFEEIPVYAYKDIAPCIACEGCSDTGVCIFDDVGNEILALSLEVDAILWMSPIYFASVPSQLKKLIDRCQALFARKILGLAKSKAERKSAWLVLVGGGGDPYGYRAAVSPIASASRMMEAELYPELVLIGPDEEGDIELDQFESFLESAENYFSNIVDELKDHLNGKRQGDAK